ncbi:MAG: NAD(P)H-hydrate dehydratase, partial [Myxococcales bacterium]|nr:NAD(P)H-hydrate dehydratase [Myxococcales bacterium]
FRRLMDWERWGGSVAGRRVLVACGKGNNGGDGLVVARLLAEADCPVSVMLLARPDELSPDAQANFELLTDEVTVFVPEAGEWAAAFTELAGTADLVVDGILGTGITPPLRGPYIDLIRNINDAGIPCIALDIPSGVSGDDGRIDPVAVAADMTITVGLPKRGLLLAPGRDFAGDVEVIDIGFPPELCEAHTPELHWLPRHEYLALLPSRSSVSHKYQFGALLVVAGSAAYGGAATLAGMGALRSGAGLVSLVVPRGLETAMRVSLPEVLTNAVPETGSGTIAPLDDAVFAALSAGVGALAVGPGLGGDPDTDTWVCDLMAACERPVVLDADGLNAFARTGRTPRFGTDQVVLTPHAGEFARLVGLTPAEVAARRFELVRRCAAEWNVVLMLKGAPSLIATPDGRVHINASGDDALARAGSGDVLTGLVGGLLAQGLTARDAALLGAYLHGLAGTAAARGLSTRSVLVREVATAIGPVFEEMEKEASAVAELRERIWPVQTATPADGDA